MQGDAWAQLLQQADGQLIYVSEPSPYAPQQPPQYAPQRPQYPPQQQYTPQQPSLYGQHQQPQLDSRTTNQFQQQLITQASPGQFKPVKLFVLFNDKTSQQCVEAVRANSDLDRQVEVVNAERPENRPAWLTGVPSLLDGTNSFFIGAQCVAWIKYYGAKSLRGINESTGTSQIMAGAPAAIDGSAKMNGALGGASFVPQQLVSDNDLMLSNYPAVPPPPPPSTQQPGQLPPQFQPIRVGKDNGNAERMNQLIEQIQNDRSTLLNRAQPPHHMQQQQMGWSQ